MQTPETLAELPTDFICPLPHYGSIDLVGEEAVSYLQGQVTTDVAALKPDRAQLSCHCDFKGKTWNLFHLLGEPQHLHMICHRESIPASLAELNKYGVFAKVDISDSSDNYRFFAGQGEQFANLVRTLLGDVPQNKMAVTQSPAGAAICLSQAPQQFVLMIKNSGFDVAEHFNGPVLAASAFEAMQIQAGVANIQSATSNEFVPQMMNMQALDAINFSKGCYMGQEVVARTKFLGKNKRAAFILKANQAFESQAGDLLEMQIGENWRRGGTVLRASTLGSETWLLAVLANDTETGAVMRSKSQPEAEFTVLQLPYSLDV